MVKKFLKTKRAVIGLIILFILLFTAFCAPLIAPHDPYQQNLDFRCQTPSFTYPFGCDYLGRCILSRVIYGGRLSLLTAAAIVALQVILGVLLGTLAGYYGGFLDNAVMRGVDITMAFPGLVLAIVLAGVMGPGPYPVAIALAAVGWTEFARVIRGNVLSLKEKEFVEGAKAWGFSNWYIIKKYLWPNTLAPIIVLATLALGFTILIFSSFSFLGLGAQPPLADWGMMVNEGRAYLRSSPHLTFFPGLAIMMTILGFNFVGDALRDIMDPRYKKNSILGEI
jgi:peptide/nickel transport system permease protein